MNGDWIALDIEDDVCCELNGNDCDCELTTKHLEQIRKLSLTGVNIGWAVDDIRGQIDSKVMFPNDPVIYLFTTTKAGEDSWVHSFDKY